MANAMAEPTSELLYLEDLHVGRRFTSRTHSLDERQITAFASEFDPQPFHTDREAAKETLFRGLAASGWHTAAITLRLQVNGGLPIAGGIIGLGGKSPGRRERDPATCSMSKARSWTSCRRVRGRTAERSRCGAKLATSAAKWYRLPRSSCSFPPFKDGRLTSVREVPDGLHKHRKDSR